MGATALQPAPARASLEIDANPTSFQKMGVGGWSKGLMCVGAHITEQPCQCRECQSRSTATNSGANSMGTGNEKLAKLYWPSRKRSPKRLIVLLGQKSGGARQKNPGALRRTGAPPPTFKFVPAPCTGHKPGASRVSKLRPSFYLRSRSCTPMWVNSDLEALLLA